MFPAAFVNQPTEPRLPATVRNSFYVLKCAASFSVIFLPLGEQNETPVAGF
jgi:hypothetical protein